VLAARRSNSALSVVLIDIDRFKDVNDRFGHLKGDEVIRDVAHTLRGLVRTGDVVARWGGEEFLIVLHNCALAEAATLARKLCAAIEEKSFVLEAGTNPPGSITASAGVAQHNLTETNDACFARADRALYRAKQAGRNRVELAT
jgi:diguanylate cyclase (GGDEF)-like protein